MMMVLKMTQSSGLKGMIMGGYGHMGEYPTHDHSGIVVYLRPFLEDDIGDLSRNVTLNDNLVIPQQRRTRGKSAAQSSRITHRCDEQRISLRLTTHRLEKNFAAAFALMPNVSSPHTIATDFVGLRIPR